MALVWTTLNPLRFDPDIENVLNNPITPKYGQKDKRLNNRKSSKYGTFNFKEQCIPKCTNCKKWDTCCGDYPERFPYNSDGGEKQCCGQKEFGSNRYPRTVIRVGFIRHFDRNNPENQPSVVSGLWQFLFPIGGTFSIRKRLIINQYYNVVPAIVYSLMEPARMEAKKQNLIYI